MFAWPTPDEDSRIADWTGSGCIPLTGHARQLPRIPPGNAATLANSLGAFIGTDEPAARLLSERAAFTTMTRHGDVSVGGKSRLLPTADGWAALSCARPDDPDLFGALISQSISADPWPAIADWLTDHSGDELAERATLLGLAAAPLVLDPGPIPVPTVPRSVAGLLVVDFSALWAGPLCAHLLGAAGARIVKVETPTRPDGARRGNNDFYSLLHGGHQSVVLDPGTVDGRRALRDLVAAADIVIEASRPRALAGFGLDAAEAVARGTVWISITAAGRSSDRIGFGDDIAASSGLVALDTAGRPVFVGDAIADPLTGLLAAALAMSETPSGAGHLWDVSMAALTSSTLDGTRTVDPGTRTFAVPRRRTPSGAAPASGADTAAVLLGLGIAAP